MITWVILLLPLISAMLATWALMRGPVALRRRLWLGLPCLTLALVLQWIGSSLPSFRWLGDWPKLSDLFAWLQDYFNISLSDPYTLEFVNILRLRFWLINVGALLILAAIWLLTLMGSFSWLRRRRSLEPALPPQFAWWLLGRPLCVFYRCVLCTMWAVVVVCVYGRPWLAAHRLMWFGRLAYEPLDGVLWFGPLGLTALLAGAARPIKANALAAPDNDEPATLGVPRLDLLLQHVDNTYKGRFWQAEVEIPIQTVRRRDRGVAVGGDDSDRLMRRLEGQVTILPDDRPQVRSIFGRVFSNFWGDKQIDGMPPWEPWNVLIQEDMAKAHLVVIAEMIQSCHDHGGIVLVIAPRWTLGRVRRALEAAGREDWSDITQRPGDLTAGVLDPVQQYNVIYASDELLEKGLLGKHQEDPGVQRILRMLRMVVVFDFHLIESSMLRLRLGRLRRLAQTQVIRVICQSEHREWLATAVGNTFAPLTPHKFELVNVNVFRKRHLVVWKNDPETLNALRENEYGGTRDDPIEIAPLLARMARRPEFRVEPVYIDSAGRWDSSVWERILPDFISGSVSSFPQRDALCMIADDRGNLIDAVLQHRNYQSISEYVLMIVARRYALRDWFLFLLDQPDEPLNVLRPIAADPQGGLTEVAMILAAEFQDARRAVPQDRVSKLLAGLKPATIETFGLFPTSVGLDRLFRRVNGPERGLNVEPEQDRHHEIHFRLPEAIEAPTPPLLSILVKGTQGLYLSPGDHGLHLSPGDHGLRYGQGTTLHDNGRAYLINHVDIDYQHSIEARISQVSGLSRESYLFHRQYALDFSRDRIALEAGGELRGAIQGIGNRRAMLRGEFQRLTGASKSIDETSISPIGKEWSATNIRVTQRHAAMLLWRLELSGPQADSELLGGARGAATAFTLAATLQDVLGSFFPTHAHRLAVVSPQAGPCVAVVLEAMDTGIVAKSERFPLDYYPRIVERIPRVLPDNPRDRPAADPRALELAITALLANHRDPEATVAVRGPRQIVDLLVLEDADHDLGVVHALEKDQNFRKVVDAWFRFMAWLSETDPAQDPARTQYYRFGGDTLASCFAFAEAFRAVSVFAPREDGVDDR